MISHSWSLCYQCDKKEKKKKPYDSGRYRLSHEHGLCLNYTLTIKCNLTTTNESFSSGVLVDNKNK